VKGRLRWYACLGRIWAEDGVREGDGRCWQLMCVRQQQVLLLAVSVQAARGVCVPCWRRECCSCPHRSSLSSFALTFAYRL